jgi:hypoxanthine phosphoribosyltransferase
MSSRSAFPAADEIISAAAISAGFDQLAGKIQPLVDEGECVLLGVMTGGLYPLVRLSDRLTGDFVVDYCHATRYEGGTEGKTLRWLAEPHTELAGRNVVIIDDIFDAGITLQAVADFCRQAGAARVSTAAMVVKDRPRSASMGLPDLGTGLTVPDRYVFGCGMDLAGRWRHLPAIYALAAEANGGS